MTTQPNTPTNEHAQLTAAKRRLRWKAAFALPLIFACSALTGCLDYVDYTGERTAVKEDPEFEREVIVILKETQAEWEK